MVTGCKNEVWNTKHGLCADIHIWPPNNSWENVLNRPSLLVFGLEDVEMDETMTEQAFLFRRFQSWKKEKSFRKEKEAREMSEELKAQFREMDTPPTGEDLLQALGAIANQTGVECLDPNHWNVFRNPHYKSYTDTSEAIDDHLIEKMMEGIKPGDKDVLKERVPKKEHVSHILIVVAVEETHAKDAAFIEQVGREKRYVFEVDAKKLLSRDESSLFECGEWLWPQNDQKP